MYTAYFGRNRAFNREVARTPLKENIMAADLTDEEYDALDEYYAENMPKVDFTKNGGYTKKTPNVVIVDEFSGKWLLIKALVFRNIQTTIK